MSTPAYRQCTTCVPRASLAARMVLCLFAPYLVWPRLGGRFRSARPRPSRTRPAFLVAGPYLPMLNGRIDMFDRRSSRRRSTSAESGRTSLSAVRFEVAAGAGQALHGEHRPLERRPERRIVFYRLPIQRMSKLHHNDDIHQRMMVESCVFRAVGDLLGKDPWDLAPDRFRHF